MNLVEQFNTRNHVTYKMMAVNGDGEVLAVETSQIGFDDVSGFADLLDTQVLKLAAEELEHGEADFSEATR